MNQEVFRGYEDKPGEACGVFGVYSIDSSDPVANIAALGISTLQHRGQDHAGIATTNGYEFRFHKGRGLVRDVFIDPLVISRLEGYDNDATIALGHTHYGTIDLIGSEMDMVTKIAQPFDYYDRTGERLFALGHNGTVNNVAYLRDKYDIDHHQAITDSHVMTFVIGAIAERNGGDVEAAVKEAVNEFDGAFSLVIMTKDKLIGVRDPHGFRPLELGVIEDTGAMVLASETAALDISGAKLIKEVDAGEMIVIEEQGNYRSEHPFEEEAEPNLCLFEFVYFARPDAIIQGRTVAEVRMELGRQLAKECPIADLDVIIGVPQSGLLAAQGYAEVLGLPYREGLNKNQYVGRSFIAKNQKLRERAVMLKLNSIRAFIEGLRVGVVDDSIVRGTTGPPMVDLVKAVGAKSVDLLVASPPIISPCFYGMDTGRKGEKLLAAHMNIHDMADHFGVRSVNYLSMDGLFEAIGLDPSCLCSSCLTGKYPTTVPIGIERRIL